MKNEEYITLHCYRPPGDAAGRRVYYPDEHQVHQGVYINSSHYLVKLVRSIPAPRPQPHGPGPTTQLTCPGCPLSPSLPVAEQRT